MTPAPESSDLTTAALRQQIILAQTQRMELEDLRDELRTQLACEQVLRLQSQQQADSALLANDPLLRELHAQNVALLSALAAAKAQADALAANLEQTRQLADRTRQAHEDLTARHHALQERFTSLRASRSWRYTAPLRSIERQCRRWGGHRP